MIANVHRYRITYMQNGHFMAWSGIARTSLEALLKASLTKDRDARVSNVVVVRE